MKSAWGGRGASDRAKAELPTKVAASAVDAIGQLFAKRTDESILHHPSRARTLVDNANAKCYGFCFYS